MIAPSSKSKKITNNTPTNLTVGQVKRMVRNAVNQRDNLLRQLLDPRRDYNRECGYPDTIPVSLYRQMFDREGIARRVVTYVPEATWSMNPEVYETEDESVETPFELEWKKLVKRHNLFHYLQRIDELSGIGAYGVMLLGFDDGKALHDPVDGVTDQLLELKGDPVQKKKKSAVDEELEDDEEDVVENEEYDEEEEVGDIETTGEKFQATRKLLYIRVFDQSQVSVTELEKSPKSPRYGQPVMYSLTMLDPSLQNENGLLEAGLAGSQMKVHWSRIIHVADNRTSSEVFGTPRMQACFNRLHDLVKLLGGSAEMFWKGAFPGFAFEVNPDLGPGVVIDEDDLQDQMDAYSNGLQRYIANVGLQTKQMAPAVASPEDHFMVQLRALCITIGVPWRQFIGSEQAQLASDQDRKNFHDRLRKRQNDYVTPMLLTPFVVRLVMAGVLPTPMEICAHWPDIGAPSDQDKAGVAKVLIEVASAYISAGIETLIPPEFFLTMFMGLTQDEAQQLLEAAEEHIEEIQEAEDEAAEEAAAALESSPPLAATNNPQQGPPSTDGPANGKPATGALPPVQPPVKKKVRVGSPAK